MFISKTEPGNSALAVYWVDKSCTEFPYIWLRDNDPLDLHPHTKERTFDLTSVPVDIEPADIRPFENKIEIDWPGKTDISVYDSEWLYSHRPGITANDPSVVTRHTWTPASLTGIDRFDAATCRSSQDALKSALLKLKQRGIILIEGLEDAAEAGEQFGDLIGFKRRTNFGVMFEVINKPDPNNLAYTALALPLHTDLSNQELVPGYQFLHCLATTVIGGESVFADGFHIGQDFRQQHPDEFDLLCNTKIPWRFHDETCDIRRHRAIFELDADGEINSVTFNAHIADVPDLNSSVLIDFYRAYQMLMEMIREPRYALHYLLQPGEMVIFDNKRVLHSRTAFDPDSGTRHLRGYYIEHNEVDSRIRVLARQQ